MININNILNDNLKSFSRKFIDNIRYGTYKSNGCAYPLYSFIDLYGYDVIFSSENLEKSTQGLRDELKYTFSICHKWYPECSLSEEEINSICSKMKEALSKLYHTVKIQYSERTFTISVDYYLEMQKQKNEKTEKERLYRKQQEEHENYVRAMLQHQEMERAEKLQKEHAEFVRLYQNGTIQNQREKYKEETEYYRQKKIDKIYKLEEEYGHF